MLLLANLQNLFQFHQFFSVNVLFLFQDLFLFNDLDIFEQQLSSILQNISHIWFVCCLFCYSTKVFRVQKSYVRDEVPSLSHRTISRCPHGITDDITLITWSCLPDFFIAKSLFSPFLLYYLGVTKSHQYLSRGWRGECLSSISLRKE